MFSPGGNKPLIVLYSFLPTILILTSLPSPIAIEKCLIGISGSPSSMSKAPSPNDTKVYIPDVSTE